MIQDMWDGRDARVACKPIRGKYHLELPQGHGNCLHKTLPRALKAVLLNAVVDHHEGEGMAKNHQEESKDVSEVKL